MGSSLESSREVLPRLLPLTSMDLSKYLVCSEPNIWVFDDLLSGEVVDRINGICDRTDAAEVAYRQGVRTLLGRKWSIHCDEATRELFDTISAISGVRLVEPFRAALVSERRGDTQSLHMDHVHVDRLLDDQYPQGSLDFLDMSRQSESDFEGKSIVPTFSLVVYLNDVGGIHFPLAPSKGVDIEGRPGRVIMFQNYNDSARPMPNRSAAHYGTYLHDRPKRLITMGVLANRTPSGGVDAPEGLIYCPGRVCSTPSIGIEHHHNPEEIIPKEGLILTISVAWSRTAWEVSVTSIGGEERFAGQFPLLAMLQDVQNVVHEQVDVRNEFDISLISVDGRIISKLAGHTRLLSIFEGEGVDAVRDWIMSFTRNEIQETAAAEYAQLFILAGIDSPEKVEASLKDDDFDLSLGGNMQIRHRRAFKKALACAGA